MTEINTVDIRKQTDALDSISVRLDQIRSEQDEIEALHRIKVAKLVAERHALLAEVSHIKQELNRAAVTLSHMDPVAKSASLAKVAG